MHFVIRKGIKQIFSLEDRKINTRNAICTNRCTFVLTRKELLGALVLPSENFIIKKIIKNGG